MAINTFTKSTKILPIGYGKWSLNILLSATGDASGGAILQNSIPLIGFQADDRVTLQWADMRQNANNTMVSYLQIVDNHWTNLDAGTPANSNLIIVPTTEWQFNGGSYDYNPDKHLIMKTPFFLGKPTVDSPQINVSFDTNVDTKTYYAKLIFSIIRG